MLQHISSRPTRRDMDNRPPMVTNSKAMDNSKLTDNKLRVMDSNNINKPTDSNSTVAIDLNC